MLCDYDEWVWDHEAFSVPLKGDGPKARRLTKPLRDGTAKQVPDRPRLVEARYRDWQKGKLDG